MNGTGTQADPWIISTVADLRLLEGSGYDSYIGTDKYFELGNDIDFEGASYSGIVGSNYFNGNFDGKNHKIKNAVFGGHGFIYIMSDAVVSNIILDSIYSNSSQAMCGMFTFGVQTTSSSRGCTITNCHVINSVMVCSPPLRQNCGVFIGALFGQSPITLDRCTVENTYVNHTGQSVSFSTFGSKFNGSGLTISFIDCGSRNTTVVTPNYFAGFCFDSDDAGHINLSITGCFVEYCCFITNQLRPFGQTNTSSGVITNSYVTNCNFYAPTAIYSDPTGVTRTNCHSTEGEYLSESTLSVTPSSGSAGDTFTLARTGIGASVIYDSTNGVYVGVVTDSAGTYYLHNYGEMRNTAGTFTPSVVLANPQQTLSAIVSSSYTVSSPSNTVYVHDGSKWNTGTLYVYDGSNWIQCDNTMVYTGSEWK